MANKRGFAAMDPALVREISSKGGKAAHVAGTAHEFTSEEGKAAGRKGGLATRDRKRTVPPPSAEERTGDLFETLTDLRLTDIRKEEYSK
jgi:uncharacterized protein